MFRHLRAALAAAVLIAAAPTAWGQAAPPPAASQQADVHQVEQYLNGVRTMESRFVQVNPDGHQLTGTFFLSRPGRMRLEYDPPVKDFIVADGRFLFYWDAQMRQQSNTPIGSSLADFILRKDVALSGDVTVTDLSHSDGVLEVTLVETSDPGKGSLTLVFEDRPLQLRKWRVLDAQGLTTEVGLLNPRFGLQLDRDLFYFREPDPS